MNGIRKVIIFIATLMVAGLSLPASAASDRLFTLEVCFGTWNLSFACQPGSPSSKTLAVKITNVSLSSASFNAIDLSADLMWTFLNVRNIKDNGAPSSGANVDTSVPGHLKITNLASITQGAALTFEFDTSTCGDGIWSAMVSTGTGPTNGQFFEPTGTYPVSQPVPCDDLACGENFAVASGVTLIARDPYNKDGTTSGASCQAVPFYVSNTSNNLAGLPPYLVHFRWDQSGLNQTYARAAFSYRLTVTSSTDPATVLVGWLNADGTQAVGPGADIRGVAFVSGPQCANGAGSAVPAPYASLAANITSTTQTTIQVNTTPPAGVNFLPLPKKPPFQIVVGTEGMLVTKTTGSGTWTVVRGYLNTPVGTPSTPAYVMSNPLPGLTVPVACKHYDGTPFTTENCPYNGPANANFAPGTLVQAQMCLVGLPTKNIQSNVWDGTWTVNGIDIGDGNWGSP